MCTCSESTKIMESKECIKSRVEKSTCSVSTAVFPELLPVLLNEAFSILLTAVML
jgi:hypothetical protein